MNRDLNDYPPDVRPLLFVLLSIERELSDGYGHYYVPTHYDGTNYDTQEAALTRIVRDMAVLYRQREEERLHAAGRLTRDELQEEARQLRRRVAELLAACEALLETVEAGWRRIKGEDFGFATGYVMQARAAIAKAKEEQ